MNLIKPIFKKISLSHTGEDHHYHPEFFLHDTLEIDIELDEDQNLFLYCKKENNINTYKKISFKLNL